MTLAKEQLDALKRMEEFVSDSEPILVLQGYAGTGKTFILKEFVQYLDSEEIPFQLCAPTHRAKLVLGEATGYPAITLHNLLAMSPNTQIFNLDYRDLKFRMNSELKFPEDTIIIIDESSMINDELYYLLKDLSSKYHNKLLFIGDKAQIAPVNNLGLSKVFSCPNKITLSKIFRQSSDNPLAPILASLRVKPMKTFNSMEDYLLVYKNPKDFMLNCADEFRTAINSQNINYVKLLAYTNSRVQGFNTCIRKLLGYKEEYNQYEFITGYENFDYNNCQFYNSLDYIITEPPKKVERKIPSFIKLPGYELELYDTVYKEILQVFVISKDIDKQYLSSLASTIESLRLEALETKIQGSWIKAKTLWRQYFSIMKSFASPIDLMWDNRVIKKKTFDYGYSMTVHKVQGTSLNTVFIDIANINTCKDQQVLRQLQYVALSRTRTNAHILL